jgi:hypothetical protein
MLLRAENCPASDHAEVGEVRGFLEMQQNLEKKSQTVNGKTSQRQAK